MGLRMLLTSRRFGLWSGLAMEDCAIGGCSLAREVNEAEATRDGTELSDACEENWYRSSEAR